MITYTLHYSYTGENDTLYQIARIDSTDPDNWEYVRSYCASRMHRRNWDWEWLGKLVKRANRMASRDLMTWDDVYRAVCSCNPREADRFRLCHPNWPTYPTSDYLVNMLRREATDGYLGQFGEFKQYFERAARTIRHYAGQE